MCTRKYPSVNGDGWGWGQIPIPVQLSTLKLFGLDAIRAKTCKGHREAIISLSHRQHAQANLMLNDL